MALAGTRPLILVRWPDLNRLGRGRRVRRSGRPCPAGGALARGAGVEPPAVVGDFECELGDARAGERWPARGLRASRRCAGPPGCRSTRRPRFPVGSARSRPPRRKQEPGLACLGVEGRGNALSLIWKVRGMRTSVACMRVGEPVPATYSAGRRDWSLLRPLHRPGDSVTARRGQRAGRASHP
jgi:hypothetical protein